MTNIAPMIVRFFRTRLGPRIERKGSIGSDLLQQIWTDNSIDRLPVASQHEIADRAGDRANSGAKSNRTWWSST